MMNRLFLIINVLLSIVMVIIFDSVEYGDFYIDYLAKAYWILSSVIFGCSLNSKKYKTRRNVKVYTVCEITCVAMFVALLSYYVLYLLSFQSIYCFMSACISLLIGGVVSILAIVNINRELFKNE